jgi:hypothetical protein
MLTSCFLLLLRVPQGLDVYIIGHQPLTTKRGRDEYDPRATHFTRLKALLAKYAPIIRVGLFGHRNIAGGWVEIG